MESRRGLKRLTYTMKTIFIMFKTLKPNWLLSKGRYNEAVDSFKKIIKKCENKIKIRNVTLFNIALCYSRMGDFEKSDQYLSKVDTKIMGEYFKWDYFILNAMNIMLLGEEIDEVESYLQKALNILEKKEFYPTEAYFYALKGDNQECLNYIHMYLEFIEEKRLARLINKLDKFIYNVQNNFLIGACYLKMNNYVLAKQYLKKSYRCNYDNYFSKKSEELLKVMG